MSKATVTVTLHVEGAVEDIVNTSEGIRYAIEAFYKKHYGTAKLVEIPYVVTENVYAFPGEALELPDNRCSDCPPIGYPTDKTRCYHCPRS
jgi:hypothetical protein